MLATVTRTLPTLPELDQTTAQQLGDDILLGSARDERPTFVDGIRSSGQSHTARAWTRGGNVD